MPVPRELLRLVRQFESDATAYQSGKYNEAQLRKEFLDPLFRILGWDIDNTRGYAQAYKEVIHEDAIRIGGMSKAPDYCFRVGGTRKFFVEAKKPSVDIKDDASPAFQLRRYAWSAKLPLSVLSDFQEFAVYDCRVRPNKNDKASTARILYLTYDQYAAHWDEISSIFSREAVLRGSFDSYAATTKAKRGTAEVDNEFLKEIDDWRKHLAQNIALRNPTLTQRELNFSVQRILDRIVFLRICEDRGIERYGKLQALLNGSNIYGRLTELFRRADERYNSGLFHFQLEKDRAEEPDRLSLRLTIDDKSLKEILGNLYYPDSPYEFSVLSADILGHTYEQFLGKIIRLTDGHRAVVEDKPEVKKAGGVFYTPSYIVDYIVKTVLGPLLGDKKPGPKGGSSKLRILDPACGSGSFLIGAYEYLLRWHQDKYLEDGPGKHTKELYQVSKDEWRLTTAERKRILLNNIYGVDIDPQAVEVTKLSLLLKVLEGETEQTISSQLKLFHERALPDLGNNIKCGNSLIDSSFYSTGQLSLLNDEDKLRVNIFDWRKEFPSVFSENNSGFDGIVGNPPYIRIQTLKEWAPIEVEFYKNAYAVASKGNYDIYGVFIERCLSLLCQGGQLGFILPNKFLNTQYGEGIRAILSKGSLLRALIHFGDQQVFAGAITYTCLLFLRNASNPAFIFQRVDDLSSWRLGNEPATKTIRCSQLTPSEWNFSVGPAGAVFEKLRAKSHTLSDYADRIFQGLITGADSVFIFECLGNRRYRCALNNRIYLLDEELMHPLCKGSVDIRRYHIGALKKAILFPYDVIDGKAQLIPPERFRKAFGRTWEYLSEHKGTLEARERGKWKNDRWYAFGRSQNLTEMEQRKILTPSIANRASFTIDEEGEYYFVGSGGGGGGGYGITLKPNIDISYEFAVGLLNSKLVDAYLKSITSRFSGGYFAYNKQYIEQLPIPSMDPSIAGRRKQHDSLADLVGTMLRESQRLVSLTEPSELEKSKRFIGSLESRIDQQVYEIFQMTDSEIRFVEALQTKTTYN